MKELVFLGIAVLACLSLIRPEEELIIHEWGTFTSLQDEQGNTLGGINTDDEPVPEFVHSLGSIPILRDSPVPILGNCSAKCGRLPASHPSVTMRLETPVVYFYPPSSQTSPLSIDVEVEFRSGWITQFYPGGEGNLSLAGETQPSLTTESRGHLAWKNLLIGGDWTGPETQDPVWLAPREVKASSVRAENGEAEKYLFYRGIGHLQAPLRVALNQNEDKLSILPESQESIVGIAGESISMVWLADIRADSTVAFRRVGSVSFADNTSPVIAKASFSENDYTNHNLPRLRQEMESALIKDGLYPDEAQSMLRTWEVSYFKNPGTRLFFLVPEAWTNHYLPLRFSVPAQIKRVMVGRIELITERQRAVLKRISEGPAPELTKLLTDIFTIGQDEQYNERIQQVYLGRVPLASLGIEVPALYQEYLNLGRFRNVLLQNQLIRQPTPSLKQFAQSIGIVR